ncbi:MAG TPA: hypothetical protein PLG90_08400 [Ignavibacteria bacterium]|nr:hypothetical protein [Ignavibacteria bacterium]
MQSHTTPIAAILLTDRIRIFFSCRSKEDKNRNFISYASFVDLDINNPVKIIYQHDKQLLKLGNVGMFDEYGTMIAKPVIHDKVINFYYMGWQRLSGLTAPYQVTLGLAKSYDFGMSFEKISNGPVLGIDIYDPISIGNVSVIIENGIWKMWYTSFTRWCFNGKKPTPEYNIKYAESFDGISWKKTNVICVSENENGGVATPSVIKINNTYHMWFGFRQSYNKDGNVAGYKIGYASSMNGIDWKRNDEIAGISNSKSGWDSEMVCYPHIINVGKKLLMFYCGNGFGKSGFGYAESNLEEIFNY